MMSLIHALRSDLISTRQNSAMSSAAARGNYRLVETLFGRDDDLRKILAWAENGSKTPSARLITGEGGAGKTRLAAMAAQILPETGWTAGFLPPQSKRADGFYRWSERAFSHPRLSRSERTAALLSELAERKTAAYPFRVLFLSRRSFAEWEGGAAILRGRFGRQEIATAEPLNVDDGALLSNAPASVETFRTSALRSVALSAYRPAL
jgi:hypothetical protein